MTSTNLNRERTQAYLRNMIMGGYVKVFETSKVYKVYSATEKGKRWLKIYKSLRDEENSKD